MKCFIWTTLLKLLLLNYFTLFTSVEVLRFSNLQISENTKSKKLNRLVGLSLAQFSSSLFFIFLNFHIFQIFRIIIFLIFSIILTFFVCFSYFFNFHIFHIFQIFNNLHNYHNLYKFHIFNIFQIFIVFIFFLIFFIFLHFYCQALLQLQVELQLELCFVLARSRFWQFSSLDITRSSR